MTGRCREINAIFEGRFELVTSLSVVRCAPAWVQDIVLDKQIIEHRQRSSSITWLWFVHSKERLHHKFEDKLKFMNSWLDVREKLLSNNLLLHLESA